MNTNDWKMKTAAILTAVTFAINGTLHFLDPAKGTDLTTAVLGIIGALGVFGFADKLQKIIKK